MSAFKTAAVIGPNDVAHGAASLFTQRHSLDFDATDCERYLSIEQAELGIFKLSRIRSSGHTVKLTETENITYLLPQQGGLDVTTRSGEFDARAGSAIMFSPNSRLTRARPNGHGRFRALALLVPATGVGSHLGVDGFGAEADGLDRSLGAYSRSASERSLIGYLSYLEHEFSRARSPLQDANIRNSAGALALDLFSQFVSDSLIRNSGGTDQYDIDKSRLRRAEEIMRERFAEPLTMVDIANELDVSLRTLQLAFNRAHGRSPRKVLNDVRLRAVHSRLCAPPENVSIADVAMDCGFTHLGRFTAAYKATFGETPSATLKRNRG